MKRRILLLLTVLFAGVGLVTAQTSAVSGVVTSDEDGGPVVGATVLVQGTELGTITDIDGKFSIGNVPGFAKSLQVSYIGMVTKEVDIQPGTMHIVLQTDAELLQEVVVTGYGVTRKAAFTGAATTLGSETIATKNDPNPIKALEGTVPGLQMSIGSGQPGAPATIYIRGRNSLNSGTQPLYVVDGVPYFADALGVRASEGQEVSPLASLNSSDIESITVLKDATATSIYGARAANGVIVITTKRGQAGKPQVNLTAKVGFETMPSYPGNYKLVNADQHIELATEALLNSYAENGSNSTFGYYNEDYGWGLTYDQAGAEEFYDIFTGGWLSNYRQTGQQTDWMDAVTRTGLVQEYGLSVSGGGSSERAAKYYVSMNYMNEEAFVLGKDLTRYAFRFNLDHAPSKWVKYGVNTSMSYTETNMGAGGGYYTDPLTQAFMMNPMTSPYDANGDWNWDTTNGYNPVALRSE